MPVPKKRHSNVRQGKRRFSNYRLSANQLSRCPECGAAILPHHACPSCGKYNGRQILKIKTKAKKGKKEQA
jgi:large subunit ribosomal protein L32